MKLTENIKQHGFGKRWLAIGAACLSALVLNTVQVASVEGAREPYPGEYALDFEKSGCFETSNGNLVAIGAAKVTANWKPAEGGNHSDYYLKVKLQVDTWRGPSIGWRHIQGQSRTVTSARFGANAFPYWIRTAVRSGLVPVDAITSIKATSTLKRHRANLPDKTYWSRKFRSNWFYCSYPSDFQ